MIKKLIRSGIILGLTALFLSCSFLDNTKSGSVVFDFTDVAARAALYDSKAQIDVELTGDYTEKRTVSVNDGLIITFEEIPVGAKIQAEATLFRVYNVSGRRNLFSGKSETITVEEGENKLAIKMKKLSTYVNDEADYSVKHYKQNVDNDEYTLADTDELSGKHNFTTEATVKNYPGFTAQPFSNKAINPDNSTVVEIKYNRNIHTVTYTSGVSGNAISVPAAKEYRYGATVNVDLSPVTRTGYDFAGWKNTATGALYKADGTTSFTMGDVDVTLTAQWQASSDTRYTVKHLKQNIDDDNYSEVTEDREEKTGVSLEQTNAVPKSYTGFTAQPITQKTIAEDSSTIVEIKYDRNTYTVSYEDSVADATIEVPSDTTEYRYGATVNVDFALGTRVGYTFRGWKDTESGTVYKSGDITSFAIGAGDVTLYAQWEANTYNIVYNLNGGAWASGYTSTSAYHDSYTYGEPTSLPNVDKVIKSGYGLVGWYEQPDFSDDSITEIASGRTGTINVYAKWEAGVTSYTINHFIQNIDDDDYTEDTDAVQVVSGKSEESTQAAIKVTSHTGFETQPITEKTINGDGSTFVNVYFNRKQHTVTYEGGASGETISVPSTATVRYGASYNIDFTTTVERTGYVFESWKNIEAGIIYQNGGLTSFTMDDADVTLTAQWTAATNTPYKVIHSKQKVDGSGYGSISDTDLVEVENLTGKTGDTVTPSAKSYTGFMVVNSTVQPTTILADGSTAITIQYKRNTYSVRYWGNAPAGTASGTPTDSNSYFYEAKVSLTDAIPTCTGYTFKGWTLIQNATDSTPVYKYADGESTWPTFTDADMELYAQWEEETQNTGINVGFGVDTTTIEVTAPTGNGSIFTAPTDYDSYSWTVDGEEKATVRLLDMFNFATVPGVYDITLTVTKDGKEYTWTGQYIKS